MEGAGRIEIFYGGAWGTICDQGWDIEDAEVACQQLGYQGAVSFLGSAAFGEGEGVVWLEEVECEGNETKLADCVFPGWGVGSCNHSQDVGIVCESELAATSSCLLYHLLIPFPSTI